jgi:hypothetical protein
MKNFAMIKKIFFGIWLTCLGFQEPQARFDLDILAEVDRFLPPELLSLSPSYGFVMLNNNILHNIRFYGPQHKGDVKNKENPSWDYGEDPVTQLVIQLFPSPTGFLGLTTKPDSVAGCVTPFQVGKIVTALQIGALKNVKAEAIAQNVEAILSAGCEKKERVQFTQILKTYWTQTSIQQSYPNHILEHIFLALLCEKFPSDRQHIQSYLRGVKAEWIRSQQKDILSSDSKDV